MWFDNQCDPSRECINTQESTNQTREKNYNSEDSYSL